MATPVIDEAARQLAREAQTMAQAARNQIESHEGECLIFRAQASASLEELKVGMKGLYDRFWVAAISTITMLATACATLIYMVLHAPH